MNRILLAILILAWAACPTVAADRLDMQHVNDAQLTSSKADQSRISPTAIKAQVLLDRARFSPGEIDGKAGDNFKTIQNLPTQKGARTLAFDPGTGRIYLVSGEYGAPPAPTPQNPDARPTPIPGTFGVIVVARR